LTTVDRTDAKYRIELVEKTFAILDVFQPDRRELSVRELVEETGQSQSSVYRIVANLTRLRILEQDNGTRRYRIGSKLYALGSLAVMDIRKLAIPHMEMLRTRFQFTVTLSAGHDRWGGTLVEVLESHEPYGVSVAVGTREPLHATASGKCALAYATEEKREELLADNEFTAHTAATLTSRTALERSLVAVRKQGYAFDRGEWAQHVTCVAAPVFDRNGTFRGAITLSGPTDPQAADSLIAASSTLLDVARNVSQELGHTGPYPRPAT
jgi:DNA-binding IclR family transcriptional regulator